MLDKKFGLTVAGSRYEEVALAGAYFALTGVNLGLDLGGRSQSVPLQGEEQLPELANMQVVLTDEDRRRLTNLYRRENEFDREFRRHEQSRIEERRIRQERQQRIDTLKIERNNIRGEINNILNSPLEAGMYGGLTAGRVYELKEQEKRITNQIGVIYLEQLMDYRVEGDYYVSNVDGIEIRMPKREFRPPATSAGTGNTPINLAIRDLDPRALIVLVENSQALNLDSVEVSSLWRQNPYSNVHTPKPGRGIDILAVTRNEVTVRFNNTNGEPSATAKALRDEVYYSMVNDPRVSQALDPWKLESKSPYYLYDPNEWQNIISRKGKTISEINSMTKSQLDQFRSTLTYSERLQFDHRHHLHITIYNY